MRAATVAGAAFGMVLLFAAGRTAIAGPAERLAITGCPFAGVTGNCLMIKGPNGQIYNITGASPRPRPMGRMIWLRGTISDRPSVCAQGIALERIRWTRVRQKCLD
jgi:hypothetical protein